MLFQFKWLLDCFWRLLRECPHFSHLEGEGKYYCQSCGLGIIARWVVLRCNHCQDKRSGKYWFRNIVPTERHCKRCGEREVRLEYLNSPSYFQLREALLVFQTEKEYLASVGHLPQVTFSQISAWIEPIHHVPNISSNPFQEGLSHMSQALNPKRLLLPSPLPL